MTTSSPSGFSAPPRRPGDLDARDRPALFRNLEQKTFDLVIIGGGITGAGIARAGAARGLDVVLLEARDLASGTSSRSSKMIHGGVRYLAQGDLSLVREAATERQILRRIAPHLARFTPFVLPTHSAAGLAKFKAAMWTFEKLGKVPVDERHVLWSSAELAAHEPLAAVLGVQGAVVYFEFLTDDARLTLANARSAAADSAEVVTYAPVKEILTEGGVAIGVRCESALDGEGLGALVRGRVIVNAAGPWVDEIRGLESRSNTPRLSLTKGIHIVVPREKLPISRTILMTAADKRPIFAVPHGDVSYLGTTDTFHPKLGYWPEVEPSDVHYLLEAAADSFASKPLTIDDVVTSWTGVRPLVSQPGKKPSEISRRDEFWTGPHGVLSIAGGKLTAYRRMAERVVDRVMERLDRTSSGAANRVDERPLVGGDFEMEPRTGTPQEPSGPRNRLIDLYGSEATLVERDGGHVEAEVRQAVRREGALRLEDYWMRRSGRAYFEVDAGLSSLEPASREMARLLDWSETKRAAEVESCRLRHAKNNALFPQALSRCTESEECE
jgi:glycerol-3-phosphate dehydrogenase